MFLGFRKKLRGCHDRFVANQLVGTAPLSQRFVAVASETRRTRLNWLLLHCVTLLLGPPRGGDEFERWMLFRRESGILLSDTMEQGLATLDPVELPAERNRVLQSRVRTRLVSKANGTACWGTHWPSVPFTSAGGMSPISTVLRFQATRSSQSRLRSKIAFRET